MVVFIFGSLLGFASGSGAHDPDSKAVPRRFDVNGFMLLVCALTTLLTGLSNGQQEGWDSFFILGMFTLVFPIAGQLSDRLPAHVPVMTGMALFGLSCWFSGGADVDTPFRTMVWWVMLGRIGLGGMLPALNAGALRALPPDKLAQGSGSLNFVRQLGAQ